MTKQLTDLRRARGLIQQAASKIIGSFGTKTEVLDLLSEALKLIKGADVPGGVIEVEEAPASSGGTEAVVVDNSEQGTAPNHQQEPEPEPPPKTPRQRS